MLGDFIKGNKYLNYPLGIQNGMRYHRLIDEYTDKHESIRAANKIIREAGIKRYAGVFIDIFFDHFLANDKNIFASNDDLKKFTENVLSIVDGAQEFMTENMKEYFGYMISYNWLYHYHSREGIEKAIMGLVKRIPPLGNADEILFALFNNIEVLRPHYQTFINDINEWSTETLKLYKE